MTKETKHITQILSLSASLFCAGECACVKRKANSPMERREFIKRGGKFWSKWCRCDSDMQSSQRIWVRAIVSLNYLRLLVHSLSCNPPLSSLSLKHTTHPQIKVFEILLTKVSSCKFKKIVLNSVE